MTQENVTAEWSQFQRWHKAQYGYYPYGLGSFRSTPAYQLWVSVGRPLTKITTTEVRTVPNLDKIVFLQEAGITNIAQLKATEDARVLSGSITDKERDALITEYAPIIQSQFFRWNNIPQDVQSYLGDYTSHQDLADRIRGLDVDEGTKHNIFEHYTYLENPADLAMRGATGRAQTEQEKLLTEQKKTQEQLFQQRRAKAVDITDALNEVSSNQFVNQSDIAGVMNQLSPDARKALDAEQPTDAADELIARLNQLNQQATQRAQSQDIQGRAALMGYAQLGQKQPWQAPLQPGESGIVESYLKGANLPGEGTRLRSFIESNIGNVAADTRATRQSWWERMNPEPASTYEGDLSSLQQQADYWKNAGTNAPTAESTAYTYWGPGGLAGLASRAYEHAQQSIGELKPGDYGRQAEVTPEEDPLLAALKNRKWLTEYNRLPGVGVSSRLSPPVRF